MEIIEAAIGMENDIIELQRACYRESAERYQDYSIAPLTETPGDLLQVFKDAVVLVAVEDGAIIGSIRGTEKNGTCHIGRVIVHPRWQNQGVGKSLMEAIEARFANAERYELFTGHLDAKNLHFYERHGYRPFETKKVTDALSFVCMEKAGNRSPRIRRRDAAMDVIVEETKDSLPLDLLLLSDPSEEVIAEYIDSCLKFAARLDGEVVGALLLLKTRPGTMEIMNVSVYEQYQNKGIGKRLINKAVEYAKEAKMKIVEIGTGNPGVAQMMLYQKCGFRIVGVELDYFRKNHEERIFENGIECRDMIRMRMEF